LFKTYLFQFSPLIDNGNSEFVHHMLVYLCAGLNETEVNVSAPCFGNAGATLSECLGGVLIAGWAVGGGISNDHQTSAIATPLPVTLEYS